MLELLAIIAIVFLVGVQISIIICVSVWCYYQIQDLFVPAEIINCNHTPKYSYNYTDRYVNFTDSAIKVDVARYLKTPEGIATIERIEKSSERFDRK